MSSDFTMHDHPGQPPSTDMPSGEAGTLPRNIRAIPTKNGVSYQGDFRAYQDVGGRRLVLCEPGSKVVIRCAERAQARYEAIVKNLEATRSRIGFHELAWDDRLGPVAKRHLLAKATGGNHARGSLEVEGAALARFIREFDNPRLSAITGPRLEAYMKSRAEEPGTRTGTTVSRATIRNELMALSGLYVRAIQWKVCDHNPVADVTTKPQTGREPGQVTWLVAEEPARLLDEAARIDAETREAIALTKAYRDERARRCATCALPPATFHASRRFAYCEAVIATMLYTGGRLMEVLGLAVEDVDLVARRIWFRANGHRTLKRKHHKRKMELWPALEHTLRHYLAETGYTSGLLFRGVTGKMMRSFAKPLRRCVKAAGLFQQGRYITCHAMRHTYATRLLCTLVRAESGRWVERSTDSVRRRLGHRTTTLIDTTYGHDTDGVRRAKGLSYERHRDLPARRLRPTGTSATVAPPTRHRRSHLALVA